METTFGKTVETRFVENYSSKSFYNYKSKLDRAQMDTEIIFNLSDNKQFQINYQKMQKYKHDLLYFKLKQHNQKQAEMEKRINTSMRKQYILSRSKNGYQSDGEYVYNSPYSSVRPNYAPREAIDDETRSCLSMRTRNENRNFMRNPRYKSLERSQGSQSFRKFNFKQVEQNQDLSWKNFNYNPMNGIFINGIDENLNGYKSGNAIIKKNQSISTPGTPLTNSSQKKHDTNFFQNNDILNDQEVIVLNQNEIDLQLRNIENLKKQHFQMEYKKSDSSTENKSQLEVVSLENALLSMNEILRNLTLNSKKKEINDKISLEKNLFSPPLSTSTSFSSSENEFKNQKMHLENQTSISISPSSSATDYSNSAIDDLRNSKTNTSFYPSDSSVSCTNSLISRNSIVEAQNRLQTNSVDKSDSVKNTKKFKFSFGKKIKKIFFN